MSYTPMVSGAKVDLLNPAPESIRLLDMSIGLGRLPRYLGQYDAPHYSVAEHCVVMALQAPREEAIYHLLHDGHEYVTGDMPHPMKQLFPGVVEIEERIQSAIYKSMNLDEPSTELKERIHLFDMRMRSTEKLLIINDDTEWDHSDHAPPFDVRLLCWDSETAASKWMALFADIYAEYIRNRQAAAYRNLDVRTAEQRRRDSEQHYQGKVR